MKLKNQDGTESKLEGKVDDYLYVIVDGSFYRLTKQQITEPKENKITRAGWGDRVLDTFLDLQKNNVAVANLPNEGFSGRPPHVHPDSCTCVAVNMDAFEPGLANKVTFAAKFEELAKKKG